jgi:hypothetical protein
MKTLLFIKLFIFLTLTILAQSTETVLVKRSLWTASERSDWKITASSAHSLSDGGNGGPAYLAIDGKSSTYWHSVWESSVLPGATLDIDFGKLQTVTSIILQQRTVVNRQIKDFRLYFKTRDSDNWVLSRSATLTEVFTPQEISLPAKRTAQFMRIEILSKHDNTTTNVCLAEVGINVEERYLKSEYLAMQSFLELPVAVNEEKSTAQTRINWSGNQATAIAPVLNVTSTPINVTELEHERILSVTTNVKNWTAWTNNEWLQLNTTREPSASLAITIPANEAFEMRLDTVYVHGGGVLRKIPVNQTGLKIPADLIPSDLYVRPSSSTSTTVYTSSHTTTNLWDRNLSGNNFHTAVNNSSSARTESVTYFFANRAPAIDYLITHPGNLKEVSIYVRTGISSEFVKVGDYNWNSSSLVKTNLSPALTDVSALRIEFSVPGNGGFIYFNELECWSTNETAPLNEALLKVFEDLSCSTLKPSAKQEDIDYLPVFFRKIIEKKKNNTYEKEYRISSYKAYSDPDYIAQPSIRNTMSYSILDNPTGIYAREGDSIYVLVGPTHGTDVSLMSVAPGSLNRNSYILNEGINHIRISRTGLLYITYYADLTTDPQPINIHIPEGSGSVNGYWDIAKNTDEEWEDMLNNTVSEVIDILGEKSHMVLYVDELQKNLPRSKEISKSVNIWDATIHSQWNLMGLYKYPKPQNNRQLGINTLSGYMSATWYTTLYNKTTTIPSLLYPGIAEGTKLWGYAHETGHQNQFAIDWRSMSESSNNLFSEVALEEVINQKVRNITDATLDNAATEMTRPVNSINQALDGMPNHDMDIWDRKDHAYIQFYMYFHHLGVNPDFYKDLFESVRQNSLGDTYLVSERHLNWYKRVCDVAQLDFTEHFEAIGWFTPINFKGNQYGPYHYLITEELANEVKDYIASKNYPKPSFRTQFLHKHGSIKPVTSVNGYWTYYRDNAQISESISCTYTPSNGNVTITNGREAAAFAVETDGKIVMYFDRTSFNIPANKRNSTTKIYAVPIQTENELIQIFPK